MKKIVAFAASLVLTFGGVGAMAQSANVKPTFDQTIEICQAVTKEALRLKDPSIVNKALAYVVPEMRQPVALICYAYSKGFIDGSNYSG